jgi:capsid protein
MQDVMLQTKTKDTFNGSWAYEAGAWNNTARDFTQADWSLSNVSEDRLFNDFTRRIVLRRIRHEVRNNPYLAGLVAKFPEAIGVGEYKVRVGDKDYKAVVETAFYRASKTIEVSGETLFQVQRIISSELLITGEIFIILLASGKIQLVPSENCAQPPDAPIGCINGIERDGDGKPTRYYFGQLDQWGNIDWSDTGGGVDARNVIHVFDRDRVAMGRGLPWILPSLCTARDLYEITGAKTKQIKDASGISGVIYKNNSDDFAAQLASAQSAAANAATVAAGGTAQPQPVSNTNARVIKLEKGTMFFLEPGEKADFVQNAYQAADYNQLIMLMLHAISSPVGLPVELWFSGLGDVNYSGFKGLGVQWDSRRMHIIDLLESRLTALLSGGFSGTVSAATFPPRRMTTTMTTLNGCGNRPPFLTPTRPPLHARSVLILAILRYRKNGRCKDLCRLKFWKVAKCFGINAARLPAFRPRRVRWSFF